MLQRQLHQQYPDEVAGLRVRASNWYEAEGLIAEAIHHAGAANDERRLAGLVQQYSLDVIMRGQIHLARKWIEMMPAAIRRSHPRINMNYGWALFLSGDYTPIPDLLDQVETAVPGEADILGEAAARQSDTLTEPASGMAYIGIGWVFLHRNRPDEAIASIKRGLALAESGGYRSAVYGRFPLALAFMLQGNQGEAGKMLARCYNCWSQG